MRDHHFGFCQRTHRASHGRCDHVAFSAQNIIWSKVKFIRPDQFTAPAMEKFKLQKQGTRSIIHGA